jgi:hypothetical protein
MLQVFQVLRNKVSQTRSDDANAKYLRLGGLIERKFEDPAALVHLVELTVSSRDGLSGKVTVDLLPF